MWCPRFIREWIGSRQDAKERAERDKEEEHIKEWLLEKMMDKCIRDWYNEYNKKDPALLTDRAALRKHIRWWSYGRKYNEIVHDFTFYQYRSRELGEDVRKEFSKMTDEPLDCFIARRWGHLMHDLREKFEKEIF